MDIASLGIGSRRDGTGSFGQARARRTLSFPGKRPLHAPQGEFKHSKPAVARLTPWPQSSPKSLGSLQSRRSGTKTACLRVKQSGTEVAH